MVESKVRRTFMGLVGKDVQPLQSQTNRLVVLTIKGGLDPHMSKLHGRWIKSVAFIFMMMLMLVFWVGMNLHLLAI
jgi:uncharacterized membrane protein